MKKIYKITFTDVENNKDRVVFQDIHPDHIDDFCYAYCRKSEEFTYEIVEIKETENLAA